MSTLNELIANALRNSGKLNNNVLERVNINLYLEINAKLLYYDKLFHNVPIFTSAFDDIIRNFNELGLPMFRLSEYSTYWRNKIIRLINSNTSTRQPGAIGYGMSRLVFDWALMIFEMYPNCKKIDNTAMVFLMDKKFTFNKYIDNLNILIYGDCTNFKHTFHKATFDTMLPTEEFVSDTYLNNVNYDIMMPTNKGTQSDMLETVSTIVEDLFDSNMSIDDCPFFPLIRVKPHTINEMNINFLDNKKRFFESTKKYDYIYISDIKLLDTLDKMFFKKDVKIIFVSNELRTTGTTVCVETTNIIREIKGNKSLKFSNLRDMRVPMHAHRSHSNRTYNRTLNYTEGTYVAIFNFRY